jgi:MFS family permease
VYVTELAPEGTAGTCLAMMTAISTTGSLVAPAAGGWLIEEISWAAGFGFALLVAVAGVAFVLRAPESAPA